MAISQKAFSQRIVKAIEDRRLSIGELAEEAGIDMCVMRSVVTGRKALGLADTVALIDCMPKTSLSDFITVPRHKVVD